MLADMLNEIERTGNASQGEKRHAQAQKELAKLNEELVALQARRDQAEFKVGCHRLLVSAYNGQYGYHVKETLTPAVDAFNQSLVPPGDWDGEIDFAETDDFGSLTALEDKMDQLLDWISDRLQSGKYEDAVQCLVAVAVQFYQIGCYIKNTLRQHNQEPNSDWDEMKDAFAGMWEREINDGKEEEGRGNNNNCGEESTSSSSLHRSMLRYAPLSTWKELFTLMGSPFDTVAAAL